MKSSKSDSATKHRHVWHVVTDLRLCYGLSLGPFRSQQQECDCGATRVVTNQKEGQRR